ncbi:SixA phosphatase family protein [Actinomyces trachealis]|uniref:SixA phosphatase family protein n=1 Tax=Actinomyces trachealis TaxID=2763540 RepID=UPI001892A208|nr:histidine phosphatase family protein [Actinomyces trachealis]
MSQRTLVLVRHSKASHDAPSDIERPLTKRGKDMAEALAKELAHRVGQVDLMLVSPAARARQTAHPIVNRLSPGEVRVEALIYETGPFGILTLINTVPETAGSIVVVGHEPTISSLARVLHDSDDAQAAEISFGVPTATAVVINVEGDWAGLTARSAHIREVFTTRR